MKVYWLMAIGFCAGLPFFQSSAYCKSDAEIRFELAFRVDAVLERSFLIDSDGFLWLGTEGNGLIRYDGYETKRYKPGPGSVSGSVIYSMTEDGDGEIWFATAANGVTRFDKRNGNWTHYRHDPGNPNSLSHDTAIRSGQTIMTDRSGDVWVGTAGGLNRFVKKTGAWTHYRHDSNNPNSLSDDAVSAVYEDSQGMLWIGTQNGGLNKFDRKTVTWMRHMSNPEDPATIGGNWIRSILEDKNGVLWIGTQLGGLNRFDRETGTFVRYTHDPANPDSILENQIVHIFEDSRDRFWVCHGPVTSYGLELFDRKREKFIVCKVDPDSPKGAEAIESVFENEKTGILWLINRPGTVYKVDENSKPFDRMRHRPNQKNSLGDNVTTTIYEDSRGTIWFGTPIGGLNRYDRGTGKFTHYKPDPDDSHSIPHLFQTAIFEDSSGDFWLASRGGTLSLFDRDAGKCVRHHTHDPEEFTTIGQNASMWAVIEDRDEPNILWVATEGGGLERFDKDTGTFTHYKHNPDDPGSLCNNVVRAIFQDEDGILWIGTQGGGMDRFDIQPNAFTHYRHNPDDPSSIGSDNVFSIVEGEDGVLWIGTHGGGLNKFNRKSGVFESHSVKNGFPMADVWYSILTDDNGDLWLPTSNVGIVKFDPDDETAIAYTKDDGLLSNIYWRGCRTRDGKMWFASLNGVNSFFPENIRINPHVPPVALTSLTQGGKPADLGMEPERLKEITFDWTENYFEFQFAALNFTNPAKNQYAYMLEGWDREWYHSGTTPFGRYTGLRGGTYRLRLKAANNDGIWNEAGTSILIHVRPPFWKAWWFYTVCWTLAVGGTLFGIFYLLKLSHEISERKKSERALGESEEKFSKIFRFSPVGMVITTMKDGKCVDVNDSFAVITGYGREESLGRRSVELGFWIHPEDREKVTNELRERGSCTDLEFEFRNKIGEIRSGMFSLELISIGGETCIITAMKDITERKLAEKQKKKIEAQLRQSRKMEAVGTLTGGIAHDFNNILSIVIGNTELTKMELEDLPERSRARLNLEKVLEASLRARDVIHQLLSFSRNNGQEQKPLEIGAVIKESLKLMRSSIPSTIAIRPSIPEKSGTVFADATQIHQILINLFTNAAHAMRENGGTLKVGLEDTVLDKSSAAQYHGLCPGNYVRMTVTDTGCGIHSEIREKIFDPYFTTKKIGEGSGMGLAVVHGIVKNHNGAITVYSEPGKGTTFHILFPATEDDIHPVQKIEKELPTGNERILFVDDEEKIADVAKQILGRLGYTVQTCTNPVHALGLFGSAPNNFDLVITDMTMPDLTGDKLAKRISKIRGDIPIIVCTGYSNGISKKQLGKTGVKMVAAKPLGRRELAMIVRQALDGPYTE